jgi:polysaccharide pyruvyl transferase WcaK-like protein
LPLLESLGIVAAGSADSAEVRLRLGGLVSVTGDDALQMALNLAQRNSAFPSDDDAPAIGVNLRTSSYAGTIDALASEFAETVCEVARDVGARLLAAPVSRYGGGEDLAAVRRLLQPRLSRYDVEFESSNLETAAALADLAGRCRVMVTGSYHAAVFALAAGVPCVGIAASTYYQGKFSGLAGLHEGISIVANDSPDFPGRLRQGILRAYHFTDSERAEIRRVSQSLGARGDELFRTFADHVERRVTGFSDRGGRPVPLPASDGSSFP